jgi:hypothetical protein
MNDPSNVSSTVAWENISANNGDGPIHTDQTTLEIYPHTETPFHYLMGFLTVFVILPLSCLLCPVLILLKLVLYAPFFFLFGERYAGSPLIKAITRIKNSALMIFHYCVFKVHYTYANIWMACFHKQDDHWYGVEMAPYRDYEEYITSFRDSRVRWRYKKKLRTYMEYGINEIILPDHLVFFRILFSAGIFSLIKAANLRKNSEVVNANRLAVQMVRDYLLLLFLPVRVHVYEKDGKLVGLSSYLKKGNTLIMLQHIIADGFNRSGLYYNQMDKCFAYAFADPRIRYVSCALTTGQSKQTCGCQPINYLRTDEFRFIPFSAFR